MKKYVENDMDNVHISTINSPSIPSSKPIYRNKKNPKINHSKSKILNVKRLTTISPKTNNPTSASEVTFPKVNPSDIQYLKNDSVENLSDMQYPKTFYTVNGHCVMPNIIERNMENDPDRITLILHMSFNRLDESVKIQTANWEGPISLAVVFPPEYTPQSEEVYCGIKFVIFYFLSFNDNFRFS